MRLSFLLLSRLASQRPSPGPCPRCHHNNHIKRHGYLKGKSDNARPVIRGIRYYCSPRDANRGCGSTFSVLFSVFLAGYSICAKKLGALLCEVIDGAPVHAAWKRWAPSFSLRSAYRWVKTLLANQSRIRPLLHDAYQPPPVESALSHATQTLAALRHHFPPETYSEGGIIAAFQHHFQRAFFTPPTASFYS